MGNFIWKCSCSLVYLCDLYAFFSERSQYLKPRLVLSYSNVLILLAHSLLPLKLGTYHHAEILKQWMPQNNHFQQRSHTIELSESFWFWVSLITLYSWLAVLYPFFFVLSSKLLMFILNSGTDEKFLVEFMNRLVCNMIHQSFSTDFFTY